MCNYRQADREWNWQWMFPQHLDPSLVQKAIRRAVIASEIRKPATPHSCRHSFAAHLYTHVLNRGPFGISSPADTL